MKTDDTLGTHHDITHRFTEESDQPSQQALQLRWHSRSASQFDETIYNLPSTHIRQITSLRRLFWEHITVGHPLSIHHHSLIDSMQWIDSIHETRIDVLTDYAVDWWALGAVFYEVRSTNQPTL